MNLRWIRGEGRNGPRMGEARVVLEVASSGGRGSRWCYMLFFPLSLRFHMLEKGKTGPLFPFGKGRDVPFGT